MIYHVVAMANNRVIGKDNRLPWHFTADLQYFKALTSGGTVIMGRKTYQSIGKPLPDRENFVLSKRKMYSDAHLHSFSSIEAALENVKTEDAFIIGGATIYEKTLSVVDGIYLTLIPGEYEGDAFYPEIPESFVEKERKTLQVAPKIEALYYEKTKP